MELQVTWSRTARVWWAYLWRSSIAFLVAFILAVVLSAIIGAVMGLMGAERATIQFVTAPLGFAIGLGVSIVPLKMILGKDFGEFRLVLLENGTESLSNITQ